MTTIIIIIISSGKNSRDLSLSLYQYNTLHDVRGNMNGEWGQAPDWRQESVVVTLKALHSTSYWLRERERQRERQRERESERERDGETNGQKLTNIPELTEKQTN